MISLISAFNDKFISDKKNNHHNNNHIIIITTTTTITTNTTEDSSTDVAARILDHFPPWINLFTLFIASFFFVLCLIQTYSRRSFFVRKTQSSIRSKFLNKMMKLLCCCLFDSKSQILYWTIPLQFSLQYVMAYFLRTIHTFMLQYAFTQTYEPTCFHYLDEASNKRRRLCAISTLMDRGTEALIKATFLLLFLYWVELTYHCIHFRDAKKCKVFERIGRRIYWSLFGLFYFVMSVGFLACVLTHSNVSYFFNALMMIVDIILPILFLTFGFRLRKIITQIRISHPEMIIKFLARIGLFCKIIGFYFLILPFNRVLNIVLTNFVFTSDGYNSVTTFIIVAEFVLFLCLPSIATFIMVMLPLSVGLLSDLLNCFRGRWSFRNFEIVTLTDDTVHDPAMDGLFESSKISPFNTVQEVNESSTPYQMANSE